MTISDLAKAQEAQRSGSRQILRPSAGTVTLLTELMVAGVRFVQTRPP